MLMLTVMLLSRAPLAVPPGDAPYAIAAAPFERGYKSMSREQLMRARANVVDERPGAGGLTFAYLGALLTLGGGIASTSFGIVSPGAAPILIPVALIAYGVTALCIYLIATRTPERSRLGSELDIIDDELDSRAAVR